MLELRYKETLYPCMSEDCTHRTTCALTDCPKTEEVDLFEPVLDPSSPGDDTLTCQSYEQETFGE